MSSRCHSSFPLLRPTGAAARTVASSSSLTATAECDLGRDRRRKLLLSDRLGGSFDLLVVEGSRMSQQSRRHDPYPWTWEIPLGIALVILMVLVCGVHLGRGIANVLAGAGWAFPTRVELFRSLPAVLAGDAAAGLDGLNGSVSSPSAVWMWVIATEVMLLAVSVLLLKLVVDRWGPGRMRGMASRGEAERLLGVTRLRKVRPVPAGPLWKAPGSSKMIFTPGEVGSRLGRAHEPRGGELLVPWDLTAGVSARRGAARRSIC